MAEIDSYEHECIGVVHCPSDYEIVLDNNEHRDVPLYRLETEALHAKSWRAKQGDLLLGGGSGESSALRISIPEAMYFFTTEDWDDFESFDQIVKAYWSMNDAYVFCTGYAKLGWTPEKSIETWLAEHIVAFVIREYPVVFKHWQGDVSPVMDGSIVRLPITRRR